MAEKWFDGKNYEQATLVLEYTKNNAVAHERKLIAGKDYLAQFFKMAYELNMHLEEQLTIIENFKDKNTYDSITKALKKVQKLRNDLRKEMVEWGIIQK